MDARPSGYFLGVTADVRIEEARVRSEELIEAVGRLVAQLSPSAPTPTAAELQTVVESSATRLLVALDAGGAIAGMLTLAIYRIPTDTCAWIEDVVVDEQARGRGIGEQLIRAALRIADQEGVRVVDLTSRSARHAANRLYRLLGFKPRETNIYRFELSSRGCPRSRRNFDWRSSRLVRSCWERSGCQRSPKGQEEPP